MYIYMCLYIKKVYIYIYIQNKAFFPYVLYVVAQKGPAIFDQPAGQKETVQISAGLRGRFPCFMGLRACPINPGPADVLDLLLRSPLQHAVRIART